MSTSTINPILDAIRAAQVRGFATEAERHTAQQTPTGARLLLTAIHPHHIALIDACRAALLPGTLVRVSGTTHTLGTFYTGLHDGDLAVVTDNRTGLSVARVDGEGASASAASIKVDYIVLGDYTRENVAGAVKAAMAAAHSLIMSAYASANHLNGGTPGDDAAIDSLHVAKRLNDYAFALDALYR